jgi:hypothetical protein
MLTPFTTILALASIKPQGPGGPAFSPTLLVAPLCKHYFPHRQLARQVGDALKISFPIAMLMVIRTEYMS